MARRFDLLKECFFRNGKCPLNPPTAPAQDIADFVKRECKSQMLQCKSYKHAERITSVNRSRDFLSGREPSPLGCRLYTTRRILGFALESAAFLPRIQRGLDIPFSFFKCRNGDPVEIVIFAIHNDYATSLVAFLNYCLASRFGLQ